jgi:hypothetical protein
MKISPVFYIFVRPGYSSVQAMSVKCVELSWVSWKSAHRTTYFSYGRRWVYTRAFHIYCPIWLIFSKRSGRNASGHLWVSWNWRKEGRRLLMGVNEITFTREPSNVVTFWKERTPWWSLCTRSRNKPSVIFGVLHLRHDDHSQGAKKDFCAESVQWIVIYFGAYPSRFTPKMIATLMVSTH